jgi:LPS sulfotransferase NodH
MSRRVTANRIFGTKIISHYLIDHLKLCSGLEDILRLFKFVHVVRRDVVRQAISAMLALKTKVWHVRNNLEHASYLASLRKLEIVRADLHKVDELREAFGRQTQYLERFFDRHCIRPYTVVYEDLISDPLPHVAGILSFLNVQATLESVSVSVHMTQSDLSEQVRSMYEEYTKRKVSAG